MSHRGHSREDGGIVEGLSSVGLPVNDRVATLAGQHSLCLL